MIEPGRYHAGSKDLSWIEHTVAESVSANPEGFRIHVENLVGVSVLEWPLVVDLQRAIIRVPVFCRHHIGAPGQLVVGASGRGSIGSSRRQDPIDCLVYISRGRGIVLIVLIQVRCLNIQVRDAEYRAALNGLLDGETGLSHFCGRIVGIERSDRNTGKQRIHRGGVHLVGAVLSRDHG